MSLEMAIFLLRKNLVLDYSIAWFPHGYSLLSHLHCLASSDVDIAAKVFDLMSPPFYALYLFSFNGKLELLQVIKNPCLIFLWESFFFLVESRFTFILLIHLFLKIKFLICCCGFLLRSISSTTSMPFQNFVL